ncbi:hypothetical protein [Embleya sp. NPDC005971]|uniref:hypothetical protein n=1 Tax=unclassified Embleya TaxID=2699296 RepID=UPI003411463D
MGVRIRRIAPACAVVVLLASGCMVGPTIDDEKPKAAGAGATGNPPDLPGKNPTGGSAPSAAPPGAAVPPGQVPPKQGSHTYSNGLTVATLPLAVTRSVGVPNEKRETVDVAIPIRYTNRTGSNLVADLFGVTLYAGPDGWPCGPAKTGPLRSGPDQAARNADTVFTYNFAVPRELVGRLVIQVQPFMSRLDKATFETSVALPASAATRPAEGPATQPGTVVVPRSTPTAGASATASAGSATASRDVGGRG